MRIDIRSRGAVDVLDISGELRAGEGDVLLREKLTGLLEAGEPLFILNMKDVPALDSTCLGEMVACRERIRRRNGVVKLVLTGMAYDLFLSSKLDRLFEIYHDEEAALDSFMAENATAGIP